MVAPTGPLLLGKYELIRKLAAGGMAEVFLARSAGPMGFEKFVVVKRILPHLAEEASFVSMFLTEARLAAQLNHPNIVQVFDFGEVNGTYFLVMELIDGVNLRLIGRRAHEANQALPLPVVCRIVSLACEGLAYAHEFHDPTTNEPLELVHRDVSPDNILIARNGSVRVVDFGIAKAANQTSLTRTGTVKGKFAYMPPEQINGLGVDRRADVYALGIVLYELVAGRKPFDTSNEAVIVRAILHEPIVPASTFRPGVPAEIERILATALAKSRDERYVDARAFQQDLEKFIQASGSLVSPQDISQLVKTYAGSPMPVPAPSGPTTPALPPMAVPPAPATIEEIMEFSATGVVAPKPLPPPPPPPPASRPAPIDVGAVSLRDEVSAERAFPLEEPRKGTPSWVWLVALFLVAAIAGVFVVRAARAKAPVEDPVPVAKPTPVPAQPRPVAVVIDAGAPEPVAVVVEAPPEKPPDVPVPTPDPVPIKPAPPHPVRVTKAQVEFRIRPFGSVWVDGNFIGETPFAPIALNTGSHSVRVGNKEIGKEVTRRFDVKPGSNIFRYSFEE